LSRHRRQQLKRARLGYEREALTDTMFRGWTLREFRRWRRGDSIVPMRRVPSATETITLPVPVTTVKIGGT
jgi:hypothetical protein